MIVELKSFIYVIKAMLKVNEHGVCAIVTIKKKKDWSWVVDRWMKLILFFIKSSLEIDLRLQTYWNTTVILRVSRQT